MAKGPGPGTVVPLKENGTVVKGKWIVTVPYGWDPDTLCYERVRKTVTGKKSDAEAVRTELVAERDAGIKAASKSMMFPDYAKLWLSDREEFGGKSDKTLADDRREVEALSKYLRNVAVGDIDARRVKTVLSKIAADKEKRLGRKPSGRTMQKTFATLRQILNQAVREDLIASNPCNKLRADEKPRGEGKKSRNALSKEDQTTMFSAAVEGLYASMAAFEEALAVATQSNPNKTFRKASGGNLSGFTDASRLTAVLIGLSTGMRLAEILGLEWDKVNRSEGTIEVSCALNGNRRSLKGTKTEESNRVLPVPSKLLEILDDVEAFQERSWDALNLQCEREVRPVCCTSVFGLMTESNFEHWWKEWTAEIGLEGVLFHELRHTAASAMLSERVDILTVSKVLGHAKPSTTLDMYGHLMPNKKKEALEVLHSVQSKIPRKMNNMQKNVIRFKPQAM